jgi:hypothetical protein
MADLNDADRKALRELLVRRTLANTASPETAREWLIEQGLYDDDGTLTPQFGGGDENKDD